MTTQPRSRLPRLLINYRAIPYVIVLKLHLDLRRLLEPFENSYYHSNLAGRVNGLSLGVPSKAKMRCTFYLMGDKRS